MNSAIGLENLLAEPVRGDPVETVKTLSETGMPYERASGWFTALGSLA
jgi:hypothetical protein